MPTNFHGYDHPANLALVSKFYSGDMLKKYQFYNDLQTAIDEVALGTSVISYDTPIDYTPRTGVSVMFVKNLSDGYWATRDLADNYVFRAKLTQTGTSKLSVTKIGELNPVTGTGFTSDRNLTIAGRYNHTQSARSSAGNFQLAFETQGENGGWGEFFNQDIVNAIGVSFGGSVVARTVYPIFSIYDANNPTDPLTLNGYLIFPANNVAGGLDSGELIALTTDPDGVLADNILDSQYGQIVECNFNVLRTTDG